MSIKAIHSYWRQTPAVAAVGQAETLVVTIVTHSGTNEVSYVGSVSRIWSRNTWVARAGSLCAEFHTQAEAKAAVEAEVLAGQVERVLLE